MDRTTEAAVVLLSDIATFYALKHGGEIDIIEVIQEMYNLQVELGEDWSNGTAKMMPLMEDLFTAYAADAPIDIRKTVSDHIGRMESAAH